MASRSILLRGKGRGKGTLWDSGGALIQRIRMRTCLSDERDEAGE